MPIHECFICRDDIEARRLYGNLGNEEGELCPICRQPACKYHLAIVRWRWRESGTIETARICHLCLSRYNHRNWDVANRDWIT
ncbi:MAG: hypothetical protein BMS9Abin02_0660 [Anaerolineae bacterium]|nr:MAG: hypothetical protein BMS9Abin02_0660 [Anaerolineae bacterium]